MSLNVIEMRTDRARPNAWNPNVMAGAMFEREMRSIQEHGFVDPITVREVGRGAYEIIDGEHRWKAATSLGLGTIPAVNLGRISDHKARKLTLLFNELRGTADDARMGRLLEELAREQTTADLAKDLPMTEAEIDGLIRASHATDEESGTRPGPSTQAPKLSLEFTSAAARDAVKRAISAAAKDKEPSGMTLARMLDVRASARAKAAK